jgi:hypothetical protein
MSRCLFAIVGGVAFVLGTTLLCADERLEGKACRSVHLSYPAREGTAFYNEVMVDRSAPGTYFCACGWSKGYFGIQEQGGGKKVVIFSVWDSNQNDAKAVGEDKRVKLLHKGEKVRIGRFGGEGTGGQSFLDYDWKIGETYRFLTTAKSNGDRSEYAGYFRGPDDENWKHLVTFSTLAGGKKLDGYYSFVEDFKRDRVSATKVRQARYGNTWIKIGDKWQAIRRARFTADRNPVTNINAGIKDGRFFLRTGGDTTNTDTKLNASMQLAGDDKRAAPEGLPKFD